MPTSAPKAGERALELLRLGTQDPAAAFRDGQLEAIRHVVSNQRRLLVVQKTGWGKSSVYFIAAKLLREAGRGPTLLISPLLSLMRNQLAAAERMGVRAVTIHSENESEWPAVEASILRGEVDVVLISPERLANDHFGKRILGPISGRIALLVVDEAHCISDWGHDFRPHYRLLERILQSLPQNLRLLATTATANHRVVADLTHILGPNLALSRGDLSRPSLFLQTIRLPSQTQRLAWLAEQLARLPGSGIIYTLTVRDAELVAAWLQSQGLNVEPYTSQSGQVRPRLENALLKNELKALVATTALGMGFDKPDLAFVIHYQSPSSVVAYYQQVGRAGRAIQAAYGVLLSGAEEVRIGEYFIASAFPSPTEVSQILAALEAAPDGLTANDLMSRLNITKGRIDKALLLLSLESPPPLVKQGTAWVLTITQLSDTFWERANRLTALRRTEQQQMQEYVSLTQGHMEFLIQALDGTPEPFAPPRLPPLPTTADPQLAQAAAEFLKRTSLPLEPRIQWPNGGLPQLGISGKIPANLRAQPGKVLSIWGDGGWGELVGQGKYREGEFADDLVTACADLIQKWSPPVTWVTCVPSLRHPDLVPSLARRLAHRLGLPFHLALLRTGHRPEQKTMANSSQQARNVDGALKAQRQVLCPMPSTPVLLIDDMVDSRWTLTVAAYLLLSSGSGPVFPLALASTAQTDA